jgi:hypothetical protein
VWRKRARPLQVQTRQELVIEQKAILEAPDAPGDEVHEIPEDEEPDPEWHELSRRLAAWAKGHHKELGIGEGAVRLVGCHPVHRVAASGELLLQVVAKLVKQKKQDGGPDLGGLTYRAGVTIVAGIDGAIRYRIRKPFSEAREEALVQWVKRFDDERGAGWTGMPRPNRMIEAYSMRAIHCGRRR